MKIAHTVFSVAANSGGIGPVIQGINSALSGSTSIQSTTYVPSNGVDANFSSPIKQFKCWGPPQHCVSPDLLSQIADDNNDLIHCHGIWTFLARTNRAWKKSGKPYLISPHGMTMPSAMKFARWKKAIFWPLFENRNLQKASCLHALSQFEADSIRQLGIKTPIALIGNGVDIPDHSSSQIKNSQSGIRTLLYLGRLHPIKGIEKLLDAWNKVQTSNLGDSPWRLQIVGWGKESYVQHLKLRVADTNDGDSIEFTGPLFGDQKHLAMHQANAFVLPSSSEAFPMALMEAWSHGLPAVATKTCNVLTNHAKANDAALFVDDSVECIAEGIRRVVSMSDQERQLKGNLVRSIVADEFSWHSISTKLSNVYRWAIDGGSPPSTLNFI